MFLEAKKRIGLIDLKKHLNSIEKTVEDYEVRYKNLHKFFYSREFFYDWDEKNNLEIEFHNSQVEGYWNNEFVFDIYMYKNK